MKAKAEIQRLENSRRRLLRAISGMSESQLVQIQIEGTWTVKDIIGHVCGWDITLSKPLTFFLQGGEFAPEIILDHNDWNAQQTAQRKEKSFGEVLAEAESTREELLQLAEQLTTDDWQRHLPIPWGGVGTFAQMIDGLAWHEEEHADSIEAYFRKIANG